MLDPATWLPAAQGVPEGQARRYAHSCGTDKSAVVYHKAETWECWCHRCGEGGVVDKPAPSLADTLAKLAAVRAQEDRARRTLSLPIGQVTDASHWPSHAALWLYKVGIGKRDIERLGIYWSIDLKRVVIPMHDDAGRRVFWQARHTGKEDRPKMLGPAVDREGVVAVWGTGPTVITEDPLSAIKVSLAGYRGVCLLGTRLTDGIAVALLKRGESLTVWLDSDSAGRRGARKLAAALRAYGLQVRDVCTPMDPKCYDRTTIHQLIGESYGV